MRNFLKKLIKGFFFCSAFGIFTFISAIVGKLIIDYATAKSVDFIKTMSLYSDIRTWFFGLSATWQIIYGAGFVIFFTVITKITIEYYNGKMKDKLTGKTADSDTIKTLQTDKSQLQTDIAVKDNTITSLQNDVNSKDTQIQSLTQSNTQLQRDNAVKDNIIANLQQEVSDKDSQIQSLIQKDTQSQVDSAIKDKTIQELTQQVSDLKNENTKLKAKPKKKKNKP